MAPTGSESYPTGIVTRHAIEGADMVMDNQTSGRGTAFKLTTLVLAAASLVAITGVMARWLRPAEDGDSPAKSDKLSVRLFRDWPKPELALIISGQQEGYLLPCGCSRPQKGGLERRYNFVQLLKARGWPIAEVDLGDVPQLKGPQDLPNVQGLIKYRYSMEALKKIGYSAVGVSGNELAMPLDKIVGEWALNESSPKLLAANFKNKDDKGSETYPEGVIATS